MFSFVKLCLLFLVVAFVILSFFISLFHLLLSACVDRAAQWLSRPGHQQRVPCSCILPRSSRNIGGTSVLSMYIVQYYIHIYSPGLEGSNPFLLHTPQFIVSKVIFFSLVWDYNKDKKKSNSKENVQTH